MFRMLAVIILTIFSFSSLASEAPKLFDRGYLAFGDMRGHFEPCGCDPKSDLGGVVRLGNFIEREKTINKNFLLLSLGNNLPPNQIDEAYKNKILLKGFSLIGIDAYLVNAIELEYLAAQNSLRVKSKYKIPFLISNAKPTSFLNKIPDSSNVIVSGQQVVFGYYFSNAKKTDLIPFGPELLLQWKNQVKKIGKQNERILLFSGSDDDLKKISQSKFFDRIISSNVKPLDEVFGPEEKENEDLLYRLNREVMMVPVGSQGVLRGGVMTQNKAPLLKDLFSSKDCKDDLLVPSKCAQPKSVGTQIGKTKIELVTWLDDSYAEIGNNYKSLNDDFARSASQFYAELSKSKIADLKSSPYIGAESCKACHPNAYKIWSESAHARAFAALEAKHKTKEAECVACHVVGFNQKGFIDKEHTPHLANVQCENCHGPRREHVTNQSSSAPTLTKSKEVCVECHHGMHDVDFNFEKNWNKIKHDAR